MIGIIIILYNAIICLVRLCIDLEIHVNVVECNFTYLPSPIECTNMSLITNPPWLPRRWTVSASRPCYCYCYCYCY